MSASTEDLDALHESYASYPKVPEEDQRWSAGELRALGFAMKLELPAESKEP